MATVNFNLERAFKKGLPKAEVDRMRITKKIDPKLLYDRETSIVMMVNTGWLYKVKSGEKILPKYWDFVAKKAKNHPGAFELNMVLDRLKNAVLKELRNAQITRPRMNVEEVRELIRNTVTGQLPETKPSAELVTTFEMFMQEKLLQVKPLTLKKYRTLINTLKDFGKAKGKKLNFYHIDNNFDRDFKSYLIHDKGLLNNTISKYYDTLRVFCSWARQQGYINNDDFKKFKVGRDDTDVIYLTASQVDSIYKLNLRNSPRLDAIRDAFVFQIQSGQRWSDIVNLKWTDLHSVDGNTEWWLFQQKGNKTGKVVIPMTDRANEILSKYSHRKDLYQTVFRTISNVKTNLYIKQVAKLTGSCDIIITTVKYSGKRRIEITKPLHEYISTHTARRTFITLSLQLGLRPEVAMKISGHTNLRVMQKYLKITQSIVKDEMLKAWN